MFGRPLLAPRDSQLRPRCRSCVPRLLRFRRRGGVSLAQHLFRGGRIDFLRLQRREVNTVTVFARTCAKPPSTKNRCVT